MDVVRGGGGEWERCTVGVGTGERCADVLLPEFAEVTKLCLPRGYASCSGLVGNVDFSEIH